MIVLKITKKVNDCENIHMREIHCPWINQRYIVDCAHIHKCSRIMILIYAVIYFIYKLFHFQRRNILH